MGWFYHDARWKVELLRAMLDEGKGTLLGLQGGERILHGDGAFGAMENDPELKADRVVGLRLAELLRAFDDTGRVTVEGGADETIEGVKRDVWATVDPIDGSLNYAHRGQMTGFPHTSVITILDRPNGEPYQFRDIMAAGIVDLRRGISDAWFVGKCPESCRYETYARGTNGELDRTRTLLENHLDLGQMNVIGEMYYPSNREKMMRAFAGQKGWLRSPGSAAYEMASVASGQAAAYICDQQKQHELGAGYALVTGAGGVAVDWDGKDLGERVYDFKTQTPCILAANQRIADQLLDLLNRP